MTVTYLETSAVLAWLFGEPTADETIEVVNRSDLIVVSTLVGLETQRAISRATLKGELGVREREDLISLFEEEYAGWFRMSIDDDVIARAGRSFPAEPVRSLEAIHLATALEYRQLYPDLKVHSYDERIRANLPGLGLN